MAPSSAPWREHSGGAEEVEDLAEELDDLGERLAQVERLTSMLTPEFTFSLQRKLQDAFGTIGDRMAAIDQTLLTDTQKRSVGAAVCIQAAARGRLRRNLYRHARNAVTSWRSRELSDVGAPIVAWVRRREGINEQIDEMCARAAAPLAAPCRPVPPRAAWGRAAPLVWGLT